MKKGLFVKSTSLSGAPHAGDAAPAVPATVSPVASEGGGTSAAYAEAPANAVDTTSTRPRIRLAGKTDAESILAIYEAYLNTPVTFEESMPTPADMRARIETILGFYPYLVAEQDRQIVGYAYACRQSEREAYRWNAELSVYVMPAACGRGLGSALYRTLIELVRMQGIKSVYARVTVPNAKSDRLHETLGFELMGLQKKAGYTCGAWRDVAWYFKHLGAFEGAPVGPTPFPLLVLDDMQRIYDVLAHANDPR